MIRKYTPADKEQLLQLIRLNTPAYFGPSEEEDFIYYLDNELEDYYVLEQDGGIVGCGGINYKPAEQTAVISWDMFHPGMQGRGLGRKLVQHRIEHVKADPSYTRMIVRTSQHTDKFYAKMGFQLKEVVNDYWAPGFDLYYMEMLF